jgi:hypothetical protein
LKSHKSGERKGGTTNGDIANCGPEPPAGVTHVSRLRGDRSKNLVLEIEIDGKGLINKRK